MKAIILNVFVDKFTGVQYEPGQEIEFDQARAEELAALNFVKIAEVEKPKRKTTSKK